MMATLTDEEAHIKEERTRCPDFEDSILEIIESHSTELSDVNTTEVIHKATELYRASNEIVAPIIVGFADEILTGLDEGTKAVFLARDALGTYESAKTLMERFPERYPDIEATDLVYAYLTRKVVFNSRPEDIFSYLKQEGIKEGDTVDFVDIGMYGSVLPNLRTILSLRGVGVRNTKFLISRTHEADGYLDDGESKRLRAFGSISSNPAVHFMEDTYSGFIKSPSRIIYSDKDGKLIPDTAESVYPLEELIYRYAAIQGIKDYALEVPIDKITPNETNRQRLDDLLCSPKELRKIMIGHER